MSLINDKEAELPKKELRFKTRKKGRVRGRNVYWVEEVAANAEGNCCCVGKVRRIPCTELVIGREKDA